jgi:hypothetical protein
MLATEVHKKSQRAALGFGIAGLNSRESRAQRGNPVTQNQAYLSVMDWP